MRYRQSAKSRPANQWVCRLRESFGFQRGLVAPAGRCNGATASNAPETLRSKVPAAPRESFRFQRGLVAPAGRCNGATASNAPETLRSKVPAAAVPRSNPLDSTHSSRSSAKPSSDQPPEIFWISTARCRNPAQQGLRCVIGSRLKADRQTNGFAAFANPSDSSAGWSRLQVAAMARLLQRM